VRKRAPAAAGALFLRSWEDIPFGRGGVPPCCDEKGLQGDERKGDRRLPVEPQRERWLATVLKRKGIRSAVGVPRGGYFMNTLAGRTSRLPSKLGVNSASGSPPRRAGGGAFNESGEQPNHGGCYHAGEDNLSVIRGTVELEG
jgi:hypothetical protein